jgi:hypothetical protein
VIGEAANDPEKSMVLSMIRATEEVKSVQDHIEVSA